MTFYGDFYVEAILHYEEKILTISENISNQYEGFATLGHPRVYIQSWSKRLGEGQHVFCHNYSKTFAQFLFSNFILLMYIRIKKYFTIA